MEILKHRVSQSQAGSTKTEMKANTNPQPEHTVIPDECGDSLWDNVLEPLPVAALNPPALPAPKEPVSPEQTVVSTAIFTNTSSHWYGKKLC